METISGGPSEQFIPDTILQAAKLNKALENWVVTEVPGEDEGEIGDVVFVTGPGDGDSSSVGGGKVLQVVQKTESALLTNSSNAYQTHNSLSITPTAVGNVLLVQAVLVFSIAVGAPNFDYRMQYELVQDGSVVPDLSVLTGQYGGSSAQPFGADPLMAKVIASSTSATTFSIRFRPSNASSPASMQRSDLLIMEIAA